MDVIFPEVENPSLRLCTLLVLALARFRNVSKSPMSDSYTELLNNNLTKITTT